MFKRKRPVRVDEPWAATPRPPDRLDPNLQLKAIQHALSPCKERGGESERGSYVAERSRRGEHCGQYQNRLSIC